MEPGSPDNRDTSTATAVLETPAPATTTETSTPSTPPASFEEAIERRVRAEEASSPSSVTPAAASVSPAVPAASTIATPAVSDPKGPIPFDRHEAALRNARQQVETELRAKLGWADGYKKDDIDQALTLVRQLNENPAAFFAQLGQELKARGVGPQDELQADLVSQDGTKKAYSDEMVRALLQRNAAQVKADLLRELDPVISHVKTQREEAENTARKNRSNQYAAEKVAELKQRPHFWDNREAIAKRLGEKWAAMTPQQQSAEGSAYQTLLDSYLDVMASDVLPHLAQKTEADLHADLQRKAAASTGTVVPGTPTNTRPSLPPGATREQLAAHLEKYYADL